MDSFFKEFDSLSKKSSEKSELFAVLKGMKLYFVFFLEASFDATCHISLLTRRFFTLYPIGFFRSEESGHLCNVIRMKTYFLKLFFL